MSSGILCSDEWRRGIWLSEQTPERQRQLLGEFLFDENYAKLLVLVGADGKRVYQDIVFGGNEQDISKHAGIKADSLGVRVVGIDYYVLSGKWAMNQAERGYGMMPPIRELPNLVQFP